MKLHKIRRYFGKHILSASTFRPIQALRPSDSLPLRPGPRPRALGRDFPDLSVTRTGQLAAGSGYRASKYRPAKPGALVCEPIKAAWTEPTSGSLRAPKGPTYIKFSWSIRLFSLLLADVIAEHLFISAHRGYKVLSGPKMLSHVVPLPFHIHPSYINRDHFLSTTRKDDINRLTGARRIACTMNPLPGWRVDPRLHLSHCPIYGVHFSA